MSRALPRRRRVLAGLLAGLALVGCLERGPGAEATYAVGGAFTAEATEEDVRELDVFVRERGGRMAVLESFPLQFSATGLDAGACELVREFASARAYVAEVGACRLSASSEDPDRPVRDDA